MMYVKQLSDFFNAIKTDNRVTVSHISLYMALFEYWQQQDFKNPVPITRAMLMDSAKISGIATYHKCIKDLHAFGYIEYLPSYNPAIRSLVNVLPV
jgi:hypothetical protein